MEIIKKIVVILCYILLAIILLAFIILFGDMLLDVIKGIIFA